MRPAHTAIEAAIAGPARRMSTPARAPIANAARVQAVNATPVRLKNCSANRLSSPSAKNGW
jgi:hypothetical protein